MGWIFGNLFLFSIIGVGAGILWLLGAGLISIGVGSNEYPALWFIAAVIAIAGAALYAKLAFRLIKKYM